MAHKRPIRLLIVDDSRFIRMAVRAIVDKDSDIEVVGEARDGADAIALARVLRPDVITMDLEMPGVDGLEAIQTIMAERPIPIVVLSGHTRAGVWTTFQALGRGAVDFLEKPTSLENMEISGVEHDLIEKIHHWAAQPRPQNRAGAENPLLSWLEPVPATPLAVASAIEPAVVAEDVAPRLAADRLTGCDLVVVAVSTGGPNTLPLLLKAMSGPLPCPMVVAQHMPSLFTAGFAEHLALACDLAVVEGVDNQSLRPGQVTILAGGCDGEVVRGPAGLKLRQRRAADSGIHPSADILFQSAVQAARLPAAVVLTGIGSDGTAGAAYFAQRKLPVLVQTPATAVVWGMPSAVIDAGYATQVLSVDGIGAALSRLAGVVPLLATR